jgi:hypothetical protein
MNADYPQAFAYLKPATKDYPVWLWIVPTCPLCGEPHQHGAGLDGDDHLSYLGHRTAHCARLADRADGYVLVQIPARAGSRGTHERGI